MLLVICWADAFTVTTKTLSPAHSAVLRAGKDDAVESAFQPMDVAESSEVEESDDTFEKVEMLGRGAAKVSSLAIFPSKFSLLLRN